MFYSIKANLFVSSFYEGPGIIFPKMTIIKVYYFFLFYFSLNKQELP